MRLTSPAQVAPAAEQKDGKAGDQDEQGPPTQPTAPGKGKAGSLKRSRTMAVLELARSINVANIPASAMEEYKVLFDTMDDDKSGTLEPHELRMQFHRVGIDIDSADLRSLLRALDVDGSGAIDADEFAALLHAFVVQKRDVGDVSMYGDFSDDPLLMRVSVVIMVLIAVSSTAFVLETDPGLRTGHTAVFSAIDTVSVAVFTAEYVLRLLSCPDKRAFLLSGMNTVDLLAIVPFYLELALAGSSLKGSQVFRVIRLVRVFRVVKVSRYLTWLRVFGSTLSSSGAPLGMIMFIALIATVVFSSALYYAERDSPPTEKDYATVPFSSIPMAAWWCIISMTTVGFGDMVPTTAVGQLLGVVTAFAGILILAIPISVIAANFHQEYQMSIVTKVLNKAHNKVQHGEGGGDSHDSKTQHWSTDFLVSALSLARSNRSRLMTNLKAIERVNREDCLEEVHALADFVHKAVEEDLHTPPEHCVVPLPSHRHTGDGQASAKVTPLS